MRAYKVELLVIDFEDLGEQGIIQEIENARFANDCIAPDVVSIKGVDIGEFDDNHPLNKRDTFMKEYERIFNS